MKKTPTDELEAVFYDVVSHYIGAEENRRVITSHLMSALREHFDDEDLRWRAANAEAVEYEKAMGQEPITAALIAFGLAEDDRGLLLQIEPWLADT